MFLVSRDKLTQSFPPLKMGGVGGTPIGSNPGLFFALEMTFGGLHLKNKSGFPLPQPTVLISCVRHWGGAAPAVTVLPSPPPGQTENAFQAVPVQNCSPPVATCFPGTAPGALHILSADSGEGESVQQVSALGALGFYFLFFEGFFET